VGTSTNQSFTASFAINTSTLTLSSTAGGDVTTPTEGVHTYNCGQVVNLVATHDIGYTFVNWTGNGSSSIANVNSATTTITTNSSNVAIRANFQSTSVIEPPTNLVTTLVGNCLNASWTMGINSSQTLIILFEDTEPTDCTIPTGSGTYKVIFNGSGISFITDYCLLDIDEHDYYIQAWGSNGAGNYSDGCVRRSITGGESLMDMIGIAIGIGVALVLLGFAFWQKKTWIFYASGIAWFAIGVVSLVTYDKATLFWSLGFLYLALTLVCISAGVWLREKKLPEEDGRDVRFRERQEKIDKKKGGY
jgi:hypothetical protein